jgi:hypothetical protein
MFLHCSGRGCPSASTVTVAGPRAVRRLLRSLAGRRYRAGDVLSISLTAAGYLPERAQVVMRTGRKPLIRLRSR